MNNQTSYRIKEQLFSEQLQNKFNQRGFYDSTRPAIRRSLAHAQLDLVDKPRTQDQWTKIQDNIVTMVSRQLVIDKLSLSESCFITQVVCHTEIRYKGKSKEAYILVDVNILGINSKGLLSVSWRE